jgi:hypothetical protein
MYAIGESAICNTSAGLRIYTSTYVQLASPGYINISNRARVPSTENYELAVTEGKTCSPVAVQRHMVYVTSPIRHPNLALNDNSDYGNRPLYRFLTKKVCVIDIWSCVTSPKRCPIVRQCEYVR